MAKIEIDTERTMFFEKALLSSNKLNMDGKMILRSLIALRRKNGEDPIVSLQYFENLYGMSNLKVRRSIRILENKRLLKSYYERQSNAGEIYRFKLDTIAITEKFPFFKFKNPSRV